MNGKELAYSDSAGIPSGVIAMWSGQSTNIPDGWALCNGQNGTPNLTDKFVIGAGAGYTTGATGGKEKHTLTTSEMPSHNHSSGSLSASSSGSHTHSYSSSHGSTGRYGMTGGTATVVVSTSGSSDTTGSAGSHSHSISGNTSSTGSGAAFEIMPPYYALCFIMKL